MFSIEELNMNSDADDAHEDVIIGISKQVFSILNEEEKEWFNERAAIMQYCGGLNRQEAESLAFRPFVLKNLDYQIASYGL